MNLDFIVVIAVIALIVLVAVIASVAGVFSSKYKKNKDKNSEKSENPENKKEINKILESEIIEYNTELNNMNVRIDTSNYNKIKHLYNFNPVKINSIECICIDNNTKFIFEKKIDFNNSIIEFNFGDYPYFNYSDIKKKNTDFINFHQKLLLTPLVKLKFKLNVEIQ